VVHRDLKPSNVFLTDAPDEPVFVKLLDFGISKNLRDDRHLTQPRILVGTPEYMAPEQARAQNDLIDARTDQYALAVVVYEMLTGVQPFAHADLKETLGRVARLDPAPASSVAAWVPAQLDAVLARAMAKDPAQRFGDVMEFARELAGAASAGDSPDLHSSPSAPRQSHIRASTSALSSANDVVDSLVDAPFTPQDDAVGSRTPRVKARSAAELRGLPLSPPAAFLLSRIDDDMTVDDLVDVSGMPRLETLRCLTKLVSCGAVELGPRRPRSR
jgi:serine/threonine-protein kinase